MNARPTIVHAFRPARGWGPALVWVYAAGAAPASGAGESESGSDAVVIDRRFAVARAAAQNPQVLAESADVLKAEAQLAQVDAAKHPEMNLTLGVVNSLAADNTDRDANGVQSRREAYGDFDFGQLRPGFVARLNVVQPLYTFGKISLRERAAEASGRAARAKTEITAADVAITVAELYESHLYAKELLLFVEDVKGVAGRSIQETQDRLDVGAFDVKKQDLLRLQFALGMAEVIENQAEAALAQTREGLRAYLAYAPGTQLELREDHLDPVSDAASVLEELIGLAREQRPELRALQQGIHAYEHLARAEHAGWFPNIFAMGFLSAAYTPDRDWIQSRYVVDPLGHFVAGALVGAQWKVQWDTASAKADEVESEAFRLRNLLAWAESGVPAEITRYHEDVHRARADIEQMKQTLPVTKEWVVRSTADFSAGFGDSREVTDAVQAYVTAKNAQLNAVYRLNLALAQLAKATGTLVNGPSFLYPGEPKAKP
jgi:outer membrane protein